MGTWVRGGGGYIQECFVRKSQATYGTVVLRAWLVVGSLMTFQLYVESRFTVSRREREGQAF